MEYGVVLLALWVVSIDKRGSSFPEPFVQCAMAEVYVHMKDYALAMNHYHLVLQRRPKYVPALEGLDMVQELIAAGETNEEEDSTMQVRRYPCFLDDQVHSLCTCHLVLLPRTDSDVLGARSDCYSRSHAHLLSLPRLHIAVYAAVAQLCVGCAAATGREVHASDAACRAIAMVNCKSHTEGSGSLSYNVKQKSAISPRSTTV